jgi:5-methylcytosine-specific restriction endonuclease McrA
MKSSVFIHADRFLRHTAVMTNTEIGLMILGICQSMKSRTFESVTAIPFVTRIIKGTSKRAHIPTERRRRVLAAGACAFCNSTEKLTVDHKIPVSRGGTDDEVNLQCLCFPCNVKKSNKV